MSVGIARQMITQVLMILAFVGCSRGQDQSLTSDEKAAIVTEIGRQLIDRYVFPETGERCAQHLQERLRAGAFDGAVDAEDFAKALTRELYSISHDKHMRVRVRPGAQEVADAEDPFLRTYRQRRMAEEDNFGFAKAEVLEGNIGYLDIRWFPPIEAAKASASAAMGFVANADALIIDLRQNGGGNPSTIQFLCSHFFRERTHLNSLYWREGNRTEEFWTLNEVDGKKLTEVSLFVLISGKTFSGGEEFAYNLKTRKRATLIGETTGGGANPGGGFPLPKGFSIFVPTGRAINPVTGTNWEGTGVEPDIATRADEALTVALERARAASEQYRSRAVEEATGQIAALRSGLEQAESRFAAHDERKGEEAVGAALSRALDDGLLDEGSINRLGYTLLGDKKHRLAIAVFKFNVAKFPGSWNTYDSLGEAYMTAGDAELAIAFYRKSLELNPDNEGAKQNIRKMGGKI